MHLALTIALWTLAAVGVYALQLAWRTRADERLMARARATTPEPTLIERREDACSAAYRAVRDACDLGVTPEALAELGVGVDRFTLEVTRKRLKVESEARHAEFEEWVRTPQRIDAAQAETRAQLAAVEAARRAAQPPVQRHRILRWR